MLYAYIIILHQIAILDNRSVTNDEVNTVTSGCRHGQEGVQCIECASIGQQQGRCFTEHILQLDAHGWIDVGVIYAVCMYRKMQTNEIVFSICNAGLIGYLVYTMHVSWRRTLGLFSGAVWASSACYHMVFGEKSVDQYDAGSWGWWTDTYEVTVMVEYVVCMLLYMYSAWPNPGGGRGSGHIGGRLHGAARAGAAAVRPAAARAALAPKAKDRRLTMRWWSVLLVVNLTYGVYMGVSFYVADLNTVLFNTLAMALGILWCMERILTNDGSNDSEADESSNSVDDESSTFLA